MRMQKPAATEDHVPIVSRTTTPMLPLKKPEEEGRRTLVIKASNPSELADMFERIAGIIRRTGEITILED